MKAKYLHLIIILFLVSTEFIFAQTQPINGRVVDAQTNEPLIGATIEIIDQPQGTATDANGHFNITPNNFPASLSVTYIGYEPVSIEINKGTDGLNIRMNVSSQTLDEMVVSAFGGNRKLIETPASIARISVDDIERFDLTSPQRVFSTLPGVKIESTTIGRYQVRIRGGSMGGVAHSESYKMYWNDIPVTFANGSPPLAFIDMGSIGTIDVIRGPSGSIYGAGLSGVALFENKAGVYNQTKLETDGLIGSYGTYRHGVSLSTGGEKGDIRFQYGNVQTDGYRQEAGSDNQFVNIFGRIFPSEKQTVSFLGIYGDRKYGIPGTISAEAVADDPRQPNFSPAFDNGLNDKNLMVGVGNNYRFNDRWNNNTSLSYQVLEGTFLIGSDFFVAADQNITTSFALRNATSYSFHAFNNPAKFVLGGEYTRGISDLKIFSDNFGSPMSSNRETTNELILGFAQIEIELPGEVQMTIGGSYNNFKLIFNEYVDLSGITEFERNVQDFSPRVALVKPINENLVIHGNLGKGFSPPSRGAFDNSNETVNSDLKSTIGWNKEIGIRGTLLENKLSLDLTFYRIDENDVILPRVVNTIDNIDFIKNENAGAIDRQGVELSWQYQLIQNNSMFLRQARWWGSYTYMDHQFEEYNTLDIDNNEIRFDGNKIPGIHPHTIVTGIDLKSSIGIYFSGTYSLFDEIYLNNQNDVTDDSYQLLNLKLGIERELGNKFRINLFSGLNNALDSEYSESHALNSGFGGFYDPAMDRNYYVGIKLNYLFR